jgi:hypothetical protein
MQTGIPTPKYTPIMIAVASILVNSVKFMKAKTIESNVPAITQYLRNVDRCLNLLVNEEEAKADKTKLTKLAVAINSSELPLKFAFIASFKYPNPQRYQTKAFATKKVLTNVSFGVDDSFSAIVLSVLGAQGNNVCKYY